MAHCKLLAAFTPMQQLFCLCRPPQAAAGRRRPPFLGDRLREAQAILLWEGYRLREAQTILLGAQLFCTQPVGGVAQASLPAY